MISLDIRTVRLRGRHGFAWEGIRAVLEIDFRAKVIEYGGRHRVSCHTEALAFEALSN